MQISTHGWDVSSAKNNNGEEFVLIVQDSLSCYGILYRSWPSCSQAHFSTSLHAKYRRFGSLFVTACRITFETTSTGELFFTISLEFAPFFASFVNMVNLRSCAFLAMTIALAKLVLMNPGSINTTFIPNCSNSYVIDSLKPSIANLELTYAEPPG